MTGRKITPTGLVVLVMFYSVILASGTMVATKQVGNHGNMVKVGVEVYWDLGGTNITTVIDWGTLEPSEQKNETVYVKNTGNANERLSMTEGAWQPVEMDTYASFVWDREGYVLSAGQVVNTVLTLTIFSNVTGIDQFAMNFTITGTKGS